MHFMKLIFTALMFTSVAHANRAPDYTIHQEYTSTRALGMGNAFIATVDDHSSIFYNPAALALRKDSQLRMMIRGGLDKDVIGFYHDVQDAGDDATKMNDVLEAHYGEHMYFRAPTIGAMLVRPNWGLAILPVDLSVDLALHKSVGPSVFVNAYLDSTLAYSHAQMMKLPFLKNKIAFGCTAKFLHRMFYSDVIQSAQLATPDTDLVNFNRDQEGLTLDGDIGFLYTPKGNEGRWFQPTFAFVTRNVFDYGFPVNFHIKNDDPDAPPKLERRFDIGTKFDIPKFWVFEPKVEFDVRDIGHRNANFLKTLHAGTELYWKVRNWWKGHWSAGINQGYWSAGFGAHLAIFQIDLATWGEEVGTADYRQESRRYIAEMSLDF